MRLLAIACCVFLVAGLLPACNTFREAGTFSEQDAAGAEVRDTGVADTVVPPTCGDGACGPGEDPTNCCADCGVCDLCTVDGIVVTCGPDQACCAPDGCVKLALSPVHCGTCGASCHTGESCEAGRCSCGGAASCDEGEECCEGTCVAEGACLCNGSPCGSGQTCCADAGCVDLTASTSHCGACGSKCAAGACMAGVCGCGAGLADCDGDGSCETPLGTATDCAGCSLACGAGATCVAGVCGCGGGMTLCEGRCVDLSRSTLHCGGCGNPCTPLQACVEGLCELTTLAYVATGYADGNYVGEAALLEGGAAIAGEYSAAGTALSTDPNVSKNSGTLVRAADGTLVHARDGRTSPGFASPSDEVMTVLEQGPERFSQAVLLRYDPAISLGQLHGAYGLAAMVSEGPALAWEGINGTVTVAPDGSVSAQTLYTIGREGTLSTSFYTFGRIGVDATGMLTLDVQSGAWSGWSSAGGRVLAFFARDASGGIVPSLIVWVRLGGDTEPELFAGTWALTQLAAADTVVAVLGHPVEMAADGSILGGQLIAVEKGLDAVPVAIDGALLEAGAGTFGATVTAGSASHVFSGFASRVGGDGSGPVDVLLAYTSNVGQPSALPTEPSLSLWLRQD